MRQEDLDWQHSVEGTASAQKHGERLALIDAAVRVVIGGPHGALTNSNTFVAAGTFLIDQWRKAL